MGDDGGGGGGGGAGAGADRGKEKVEDGMCKGEWDRRWNENKGWETTNGFFG